MVNYEYARSYRPVVEEVFALRKGKKFHKYAISLLLAHKLPEFPRKTWLSMLPDRRWEILSMLRVAEQPDAIPSEALQMHRATEPEGREILDDLNSDDKSTFVVQADFSWIDKDIAKRFLERLGYECSDGTTLTHAVFFSLSC